MNGPLSQRNWRYRTSTCGFAENSPDHSHCRTGLEDNVRWDKNRLAASNAELVARVAALCGEYNRIVATPAVARRILGLN